MSTGFRFTLAEYDRMIESEILGAARSPRVELIYGEVRDMSPPGPTHEYLIDLLAKWSHKASQVKAFLVRIQNSIGLPNLDSAPQPDVAWVREQDYRHRRPQAEDVLLVIEVADSSLEQDRTEKAGLYAAGGIPEFWIVNVREENIEVYREPSPSGYREKRTFDGQQELAPLVQPEAKLRVSSLFA